MNINELLKGVDCACGRHHACNIDYVYIEENACARLQTLCKDYKHILLVADENTYAASGHPAEMYLAGKIQGKVIFPGTSLLIPDERAIHTVEGLITPETDLLVGVGSGVVQDLCKYCCHEKKLPYMIVATAPSMDGYASDGAAMITGGMKVTYKAGVPKAILADTRVLAKAPYEMIAAGYGDIIGKFSALNDWKLSHVINDEYFCPFIYDKTMEVTKGVLALAEGIRNREPSAMKALMEALVLVGIFMSFAGSSRPASGSEHHLSHYYEISGIVFGRPYFPHGLDVAYSTVITAKIREKLLETDFRRPIFRLERDAYMERLRQVYGRVAEDCALLQDKCNAYHIDRKYAEKEAEIKKVLAGCPTAYAVEGMLKLVGLDMRKYTELYGTETIRNAVAYAKELKDRYTVLWIYYDLLGEEAL